MVKNDLSLLWQGVIGFCITLLGDAIVNEFQFLQPYCTVISFPCGILRVLIFIVALITFTAVIHIVWIVYRRKYPKETESIENTKLNLSVEGGTISKSGEQGGIVLYFVLDVINNGDRKIIELDAHPSRIDQITPILPENTINGISTLHMKRCQWEDRSYEVELKPGISELKKIRISMLDCSNEQFTFIHEGESRNSLHLQQNALYKVSISFKGKLEGSNPDYKYFHYETEFICSPRNCILDSVLEALQNPNIPKDLKRKIVAKTLTKPERENLADEMVLDIQEFRDRFHSITPDSLEIMQKKYISAHEILEKVNEEKRHAQGFKEINQIEEKIRDLNGKFDQYRVYINILHNDNARAVYAMLDVQNQLWRDDDPKFLRSKIESVIKQIIELLREEIRNEKET